jgi:HTH-type transcriptional regulator, transcriptional repressor of NAD biosynthesis genes
MTRPFRRGLVVGKFAPLHRGHEMVIERALAECDEVIVLSYSKPELAGCEPNERARWLEARFPGARRVVLGEPLPPGLEMPHNDAPDDDHRRFVARVCLDVLGTTVQAVFTSEDYGDGFARKLTDCFRQRISDADEVSHVLVDRARTRVPISGTLIRSDVHRHRSFLSPEVYASFVDRVCLLGGESSGKTTLAASLASAFDSSWAPEYGRELWEERAGNLRFEDMVHIARTQIDRERVAAGRARRWLFCDTSPLTTLLYSQDLFGKADSELAVLASRPYHRTILCEPDFEFVQDGTRRDDAFRRRQHEWYLRELEQRRVAYDVVAGTLDARVARVRELLAGA